MFDFKPTIGAEQQIVVTVETLQSLLEKAIATKAEAVNVAVMRCFKKTRRKGRSVKSTRVVRVCSPQEFEAEKLTRGQNSR